MKLTRTYLHCCNKEMFNYNIIIRRYNMIPKRKHCIYVYFLFLYNYILRCLQVTRDFVLFLHLQFTYYNTKMIIIIIISSVDINE